MLCTLQATKSSQSSFDRCLNKFKWNSHSENAQNSDEINLLKTSPRSALKFFVSISRWCIVHELQAKAKFAKIIKKKYKHKIEVLINNSSERNKISFAENVVEDDDTIFGLRLGNKRYKKKYFRRFMSKVCDGKKLMIHFQGNYFSFDTFHLTTQYVFIHPLHLLLLLLLPTWSLSEAQEGSSSRIVLLSAYKALNISLLWFKNELLCCTAIK